MDSEEGAKLIIERILKLSEEIYRLVRISVPSDWMLSDMTVAQFRALLFLDAEGPSRMSAIASSFGIALSSATGLVEGLVKKGLVIRRDDPEDRRVVICELSPLGRDNLDRLFGLGRSKMQGILDGLTVEQLGKAEEVARLLLANVRSQTMG